MVFQFKYPNLLPKSKEERTEVISRLLFTFIAHKLQKHLNSSNTFSYLFKKYSFNHIQSHFESMQNIVKKSTCSFRFILKTQTSHQTSVDGCRQMQTNHRRMQTSVDESLDECRRIQTSVDESRDECRQIYTSVDESKKTSLIPEKVPHGPILLLLQLCNSRLHRFAKFQFCNFICDYCSSQCSHSSHQQNPFPIVSLHVREVELN